MSTSAEVLEGPRFEIAYDDEAYPWLLRFVEDAPKRLYGIGNPEVLVPGVAVIGSRKATPYGLAAARRFALHAGLRGVPIISGGARGCDQEAHKAALEVGAPTVVVFGSGANVPYPKRGIPVFKQVIANGGAIISENPWGFQPLAWTFRKRNRIIAGMAMLLIIAEAGMPSGTFSTADAALSADRVVAAVPGSITSPTSKGSNFLITQGAHPVIDEETLDAIIEEAFVHLPLSISEAQPRGNGVALWDRRLEEDPLLAALASEAYAPGELTAYFGFSPAELAMQLSQYEAQGLVERGLDGRYQAVKGTLGAANPTQLPLLRI